MIIMILSIFIAITDWPVPIKTMYFFNFFSVSILLMQLK